MLMSLFRVGTYLFFFFFIYLLLFGFPYLNIVKFSVEVVIVDVDIVVLEAGAIIDNNNYVDFPIKTYPSTCRN